MHPVPVFHTIITVDVAGSGSRPVRATLRMRQELRQILTEVLGEQGIPWESVHPKDDGDAYRLLLGPDRPAERVLGPFLSDLEAALRGHRMFAAESALLRLRVAVHHGLAYLEGGEWAGPAFVLAARLLDSGPLRQALATAPEANLALIVSEAIYNDVITSQYGPPAQDFQQVEIAEKETRTKAWIYVPGNNPQPPVRRAPSGVTGSGRAAHPERGRLIGVAGLVVAILAIVVAVITPEIRCKIGLGECPPPAKSLQTVGGDTQTWTDYRSGGGTAGPIIPNGTTVWVSCRTMGLKLANGNPWWYRIASPSWDDQFWASADAFYNNGQTTGPLRDTPFVDESVAICDG